MEVVILLLLGLCCVPALGELQDFSMEKEEMDAIQDRLARFEGLEKLYKSLMSPEENREDTCLPIGASCYFASGPNCCGIRTRCILLDHATPATRYGSAQWHSACREYKLGVALDETGKFFSNLFG